MLLLRAVCLPQGGSPFLQFYCKFLATVFRLTSSGVILSWFSTSTSASVSCPRLAWVQGHFKYKCGKQGPGGFAPHSGGHGLGFFRVGNRIRPCVNQAN